MKKEKLITRTIITTDANILCMDMTDIGNPKPINTVYQIPGEYENNADALKVAKALFETADNILVAVVGMAKRETLYGMPESVFIANATVLPPRSGAKVDE